MTFSFVLIPNKSFSTAGLKYRSQVTGYRSQVTLKNVISSQAHGRKDGRLQDEVTLR